MTSFLGTLNFSILKYKSKKSRFNKRKKEGKRKEKRKEKTKERKRNEMIKLTIVDPEGGEATQKSKRLKDPNQKNISLRMGVSRTDDNKGMNLSWSAHFSKKHSKDKDKEKDKKSKDKNGCCYSVETTIVHPTDSSKNITQSNINHQFIQTHSNTSKHTHNHSN